MTEWVLTDFGVAGLIVGGLVYVIVTYIKCQKTNKGDVTLTHNLADVIKSNTELLTLLKEQSQESKRNNEKQQEAMQGMIIAINNLVALSQETLSRVKELS